ncbi:MAG: hypothetical protein QM632_06160 [Micrococcaceae bacterium]
MKSFNPINLNIMDAPISLTMGSGFSEERWKALAAKWSRATSSQLKDAEQLELKCSKEVPEDVTGRTDILWNSNLDRLEEQLSTNLTLRGINFNKGKKFMLHACGFSNEEGKVIAFVAASGTGKTTLAKTLGVHFGYVSDETVVVDFDLNVTAYPKPLSIIVASGQAKKQVSPDDIALQKPVKGLKLHKLVLLARDKDPEDPKADASVEPVGLIDAIIKLTPEFSYLSELDTPLQQLRDLIETTDGVLQMNYVEAETLLPHIQRIFDA